MATTTNQITYPTGIRTPSAIVTAANTTMSGSSLPPNIVLLGAIGANGSYLRRLFALPNAAVTQTQLQLFKWNGTNVFFAGRAIMSASSLAAAVETDFNFTDNNNRQFSGSGPAWVLYVGIDTGLAAGITFTAELQDL